MKDIYSLINFIFIKKIDRFSLKSGYNNELVYQVLGSRLFLISTPIEALYYLDKASALFLSNNNILRYIQTVETKLACYNKTNEYHKTIKEGEALLINLDIIDYKNIDYHCFLLHMCIAYIGSKLYKEALDLLDKSIEFNDNDIVCYMYCSKKIGNYDENYLYSKLLTYKDKQINLINNIKENGFRYDNEYSLSSVLLNLIINY